MKTYAINITDITYDIVSAFLPPGFLFIPRSEIVDHSVAVINDFSVIEDAEDGGEVLALQNAWYGLNEFSLDFVITQTGVGVLGPFFEVRRR
jgi:hypothetical protein